MAGLKYTMTNDKKTSNQVNKTTSQSKQPINWDWTTKQAKKIFDQQDQDQCLNFQEKNATKAVIFSLDKIISHVEQICSISSVKKEENQPLSKSRQKLISKKDVAKNV